MATENKGVMVYLPKEVEKYITSFCTEYNITRKDKEGNVLPSLGTGVVTYLKSKISGESPDDILTKPSKVPSTGLSKEEVLDIVDEYFTSHPLSNGLSKDEVLDLIKSHVLSNSPIDEDIERMVRGQIEPLADLIAELETYTRLQFAAVRDELKAKEGQVDKSQNETYPSQPSFVDSTSDLTGKSKTTADGGTKTWGEFFKMVSIDALTASDAQKKENIDIRTQQIAQGILAAKERGLGEWAVKVAGRSFVRVGD
jgi:hypothetical protein